MVAFWKQKASEVKKDEEPSIAVLESQRFRDQVKVSKLKSLNRLMRNKIMSRYLTRFRVAIQQELKTQREKEQEQLKLQIQELKQLQQNTSQLKSEAKKPDEGKEVAVNSSHNGADGQIKEGVSDVKQDAESEEKKDDKSTTQS